MVKIKDIAERLGISVSTVSKGLNGASDISDELRQLVLDTAVEMGYTTKRSRKKENRKLCILIENMNYKSPEDFGYEIILGFRQHAFRQHWNVDIVDVTPELQASNKYDTFLLKNGYSGAFLMGFTLHEEWMGQLDNTAMPTILFDNSINRNPNVGYVGTDSYEGIAMVIEHLHSLGHTNIAFLNGPLYSMVSDHRQEAFENSMRDLGLTCSTELMARGSNESDSACHHVPGFLDAGATAIVCGNDRIASGVIRECDRQGLHVPEDVSVVGFDDLPLAAALTPALTTIRQERNELGRCAYVTLNALVHHIPISRTLLRPALIRRSSTARVNSNR